MAAVDMRSTEGYSIDVEFKGTGYLYPSPPIIEHERGSEFDFRRIPLRVRSYEAGVIQPSDNLSD